jgi:hypothetical protein
MEYSRCRKPAGSQSKGTSPGERALGSAAKCMSPMPQYPLPEDAETIEVSWYRIVVEVALHNRLEPLPGLTHGIVHAHTELLLNLPQFRPHAFANRLALHRKPP